MRLDELLAFDAVIVQCHNNPDVDAIASGYALMRYFEDKGKPVRLIYSGFNQVTKPNISELVALMKIPLEYVGRDVSAIEQLVPGAARPLLITVDCQHGAGNVARIESPNIAVIDHHLKEVELPRMHVLEPYLGSCCTVVWRLLKAEGYDVNAAEGLATVLYYGLYTDTNSLSEIYHPIDRDMLEALVFDAAVIKQLKNNNLTQAELVIAGNALIEARHDTGLATNLFMAAPCDPNILGFISDLTIQAQGVDVCAGFCEINGGVKLSIRSATNEVMANELAAYLTEGCGSGGGNREKAGGFMQMKDGQNTMDYLEGRLKRYYTTFNKLVAGEDRLDTERLWLYKKKRIPVGYVQLTDIYPKGTEVNVRTLEGDASFTVSEDSYLMVGIQGEVYPIDRDKFERTYERLAGDFSFMPELIDEDFYQPTVRDRLYGRQTDLIPHIRSCVSRGESHIYAQPLDKNTKVFAKWYKEGYMFGKPGDYVAARKDDPGDIYVIAGRIFDLTYERVEQ